MMESQAQTCLMRRWILRLAWILWRAPPALCHRPKRDDEPSEEQRCSGMWASHWGAGEKRQPRFTQTETKFNEVIILQGNLWNKVQWGKKSYCFMGYMMESLHQTAAVRITVPLSGRAFPSAVIGRDTLSRCLSLLLIGCRGLTGRRRSAPLRLGKKSPPEVSINQREVRGTEREKGRRRLGGLRDAQNDRPRPNYRSSRLGAQPRWLSLPSKVWRSVSSHSWDYFGHLVSLRPAVNTDVCIFSFFSFFLLFCFTALDGRSGFFAASSPRRVDLREMSERRRSAAALSSRAHAFSVEALIGSNKKRKLRGWEEKELELSMESLAADGEDPAHCLDMDPGQCADMHHTAQQSGYALCQCRPIQNDESRVRTWLHDPTHDRACSYKTSGFHVKLILNSVRDKPDTQVRDSQTCWSIFRHKKCFCRISSKN